MGSSPCMSISQGACRFRGWAFVVGVDTGFTIGSDRPAGPANRKGEQTMRFMMIMIPNIGEEDWTPRPEAVAAMGKYNEELTKAGVLLTLDGLQPPGKGARVAFAGGR